MNTEFQSSTNKGGQKQNVQAQYGVGMFLFEVFKVFLLAVVIIVPIRVFLFQPFFVKGASMEPNFHQGEYLIVNEWGYKYTKVGLGELNTWMTVHPRRDLERGDVIVFRAPKTPSQFFIKRVIALPGESIRIQNNQVMIINDQFPKGFILDESAYLNPAVATGQSLGLSLSQEEYFVMGDNRSNSHDSRSWGALHKNMVIGKVFLRAWPASEAEIFIN